MQSRDANRVSDMATLNSALGFFAAQGGSVFGNASTTYISIPDPAATSTAGDQCQGLGLPSLPTGDTYQCAATSTYRATNGTGWLPTNFMSLTAGSPVGVLPTDPVNQSSSNLFYTYTTNGTQYEVTSILESQKYKTQFGTSPLLTDYPEVITQGNNLALSELYNPSGLVGYWNFEEGSGTTAIDVSGNGNNGTWNGTQAGSSGYYSGGKVGGYAGYFNGNNDYVSLSLGTSPQNLTVGFWEQEPLVAGAYYGVIDSGRDPTPQDWYFLSHNTARGIIFNAGPGEMSYDWNDSNWHFIVGVYNNSQSQELLYVDGTLKNNSSGSRFTPQADTTYIGKRGQGSAFLGSIDDVRIYNRALSASEIQALYNAEK